ncbi:ADP-ribosylation crystallin J1 [Pycnococcus provasolii]
MTMYGIAIVQVLYGVLIGDALSMPVHWYYNVADIYRDFPPAGITGLQYEAPKSTHPGAFMDRSSTGAQGRGTHVGDVIGRVINHGKKSKWAMKGTHYHDAMLAGENTLNALCARVLTRTLAENDGPPQYDVDAWLDAYVTFMTTPGSHNDTYAESYHRHFFANYDSGVSPRECATNGRVKDHNFVTIGALVSTPVVVLTAANADESEAVRLAVQHARSTHGVAELDVHVKRYAKALHRVLRGASLKRVAEKFAAEYGVDVASLIDTPDSEVVAMLGPQCYLDGALPIVFYLASKYADDPVAGLLANTNSGGENAHRGSVLGALLGAQSSTSWPTTWKVGLHDQPAIDDEIRRFARSLVDNEL